MLSTLIALSILAAAPPPSDDKIWDLVFQLGTPEKQASATEQLRPISSVAMPAMLRAAHAAGVESSLVGMGMFCDWSLEMRLMGRGIDTPGMRAGMLLITLARQDAALLQSLAGHADPLGRMFALVAADRKTPVFARLLEVAAKDTAPQVVRLAGELSRCSRGPMTPAAAEVAASLQARLKQLDPTSRCDDASQAPQFVKAFMETSDTGSGWSTSGGEDAWVTAHGMQLHWKCALAVYAGLVSRGLYEPSLLIPLMEDAMPSEPRKQAGALLQRDEGKFPVDKRDAVASKLVMAGVPSSAKQKIIVPDNPKFTETDTLAAAALQRAPGAREAIERRFICRGMGLDDTISLLGFVPSTDNADAAVRIAQTCKDGRPAAVGALIRMKDPRAVELLPSVIHEPFVVSKLGPALRDSWSPEWERVLLGWKGRSRNFEGLVDAAGHPELKKQ